MGFRRAFACGTRGTPCITRGSFIRVGSNFAGTNYHVSKHVFGWDECHESSLLLTTCL